MSSLNFDIVAHIVGLMPFTKQYDIAAELFPGLKGNDYCVNFVEDKVYLSELVSRVYDDLPDSCVTKYGLNLPDNQKWIIKFDTPIYSLPKEFDHKQSLHKIPVWKKLFDKGHVGEYKLRLINQFSTSLEHFDVIIDIFTTKGYDKIELTVDVDAYDNNQETIIHGCRTLEFDYDDVQAISLFPESSFTSYYCYYSHHDILTWPEEDVQIRTTNPPCCSIEYYDVGLTYKQIQTLLY